MFNSRDAISIIMTTTKKEKLEWQIIVAAIVGLVAIECMAMYYGYNGTVRMIIIAAVCGLAGWALPQPKLPK